MEFGEERTVKKTEIYQRWLDISVQNFGDYLMHILILKTIITNQKS